jgi:predicted KAP-like P-loop ATPase
MSDQSQWVNIDAEIHTAAEDRLGRVPFCRRVVDRIAAAGRGPSVVFGLAGAWGAGKTSVLNIVGDLLKQEHGEHWAVVQFTAWSASDVEALTDEFYQAIATAMPRDTEAGRHAVNRLLSMAPVAAAAGKAAAVAAIESKLGKGVWAKSSEATVDALADRMGKFKLQPDPFITRFEKLSQAIDKAGRNILVVVDDIDRLHTDELLGVMKAVRLLGRFNRVHYLLSYDQQTVLDVLQATDIANKDEGRARQYLEKIVQYPFVLPPLQVSQVEAELDNALQMVATLHHVSLEHTGYGRLGTIDRIIHALPDADVEQLTLRRISRLAGQVEVLLTLVGPNNLNFTDAVLVTFVRLFYPALYDELPRWRTDLTKDTKIATFSTSYSSSDEPSWTDRIADALNIAFENRVDNPELEAVLRLLSALFPRAMKKGGMRHDDEPCRIDSREYFGRYVALGIPVGDIGDSAVRAELASLCRDGELHSDSAILAMLANPQTAALVCRKAVRVLDVVAECPAAHASAAAIFLSNHVHEGDRLFGGWAAVIKALLGHAVTDADTPEQAQRIIENFAEEAGLLATAEALFRSSPLDDINSAALLAACKSISSRIVDVCRQDLMSDVALGCSSALTCLDFLRLWSNLPSGVISQLAAAADTLMSDGTARAHELAGRFVSIPPNRDTPLPVVPSFFHDEFETLVPRSKWVLDQLPDESQVEIVPGDESLRNRVNVAALNMRALLTASTPADEE